LRDTGPVAKKSPTTAAASQRPLWARVLDVLADVLVGVGAAVAVLMLLAALAVLVGVTGSGLGQWVLDTSAALLGPIESTVASLVTIEDDRLMLAAALGVGALVWGGAGWLLAALVRPR
jgi:hypothetical protein